MAIGKVHQYEHGTSIFIFFSQQCLYTLKKINKIIPIHNMANRGSGGTAPLILRLGTGRRWVVSLASQSFSSGEVNPNTQ